MPKINILYQSKETIFAKFHRSGEWAEYNAVIKIKESGKLPVEIKMKLEGQPSFFDLPKTKIIKAENITMAFEKVVRFFRQYHLEFR